jgi:hypothetical protein
MNDVEQDDPSFWIEIYCEDGSISYYNSRNINKCKVYTKPVRKVVVEYKIASKDSSDTLTGDEAAQFMAYLATRSRKYAPGGLA